MPHRSPPSADELQEMPECRKVVKPPKASVSFQAADSDGNINLKIWRVYPLQFAILEIGSKTKEARPETPVRAFFVGIRFLESHLPGVP
jgi:hypothetical protein